MSISKVIAGLVMIVAVASFPGKIKGQNSFTDKVTSINPETDVITTNAGKNAVDWLQGYPEFGNFTHVEGSIEMKNYRKANSRTYFSMDGSISTHASSVPVHYLDNGEWKNIDPSIAANTSGNYADHAYTNTKNTFKTYYPQDISAQGLVSVYAEDKKVKELLHLKMYYMVNGAEQDIVTANNATAQVDRNKVVYPAAYGSFIDIEFTQHPDMRKMDYVLNDRAVLDDMPQGATHLVFEETLELPEGWAAITEDNTIILNDENGAFQARYLKPICHEKVPAVARQQEYGQESEYSGLYEAEYQLEQQGNNLIIKTLVNINWLLDPSRQYPVIVDPSVSASAGNAGYYQDNGLNNRQVTTTGAPGGTAITSVDFSVTTTASYYGGSCGSWWVYGIDGVNYYCGGTGATNWNGNNPNRTWSVSAYDWDSYVDYVYYYFTITAHYNTPCVNGYVSTLSAPKCSEQTVSVGSGERRDVAVINGRSYRFRLTNCPSGWTMQITGRNTSNTQMFQQTSGCNVTANWTATYSGTLRLNINRSSCLAYQGNNSAVLRWRQNPPSSGATTTWIGSTNAANNWNLDANWNNCVPNINIHANIPNTGVQPRIGASSSAKTLTIASGRVVSVECSNCLQIGNP